jgi:hypothetical protein
VVETTDHMDNMADSGPGEREGRSGQEFEGLKRGANALDCIRRKRRCPTTLLEYLGRDGRVGHGRVWYCTDDGVEVETEYEMPEDKISQTKQVRKSEIPFTPSPDANQTRHLTWPVLQSAATQPWVA